MHWEDVFGGLGHWEARAVDSAIERRFLVDQATGRLEQAGSVQDRPLLLCDLPVAFLRQRFDHLEIANILPTLIGVKIGRHQMLPVGLPDLRSLEPKQDSTSNTCDTP